MKILIKGILKMRQFIYSILLSFVVIFPVAADSTLAATNTKNASSQNSVLKIGVVDVRAVVQKSSQLQMINKQLTQKFKPREQSIVQAQASYKAEEEKFNKEVSTLSEAQKTKIEHEIIANRANLQAMITAFQQDLDNEQNAAMQKLLSEIASIVNDIAKTENYDLILQGENVPYVTDKLNITDQVLKILNDK